MYSKSIINKLITGIVFQTIVLFIGLNGKVFPQDQSNMDKFAEKQKMLSNQLNDIEYLNQKLQKLRFSGSYFDKYLAIKSAFEMNLFMEKEFLADLNNTFSIYENFKKKREELTQVELKLFNLQLNMAKNEDEYYVLLKDRRLKNDYVDSLEIQVDTLLSSKIKKFIQYTQLAAQSINAEKSKYENLSWIYQYGPLLNEMDKNNAPERMEQFYAYSMGRKDYDQFSAELIKSADTIVCRKSDSIIKNLSLVEFFPFFVNFLKVKEKYSYSPNVSLLESFDFIENKFAYYAETNYKNNFKTSFTMSNCTPVISIAMVNDTEKVNIDYYIRIEPITSDEISLFYISQKENNLFSFDDPMGLEQKNKVLSYFSIWSGFDVLSKDDKKYIIELLKSNNTPDSFKADFKEAFNIKSDDELFEYLNYNEFYKINPSAIQK